MLAGFHLLSSFFGITSSPIRSHPEKYLYQLYYEDFKQKNKRKEMTSKLAKAKDRERIIIRIAIYFFIFYLFIVKWWVLCSYNNLSPYECNQKLSGWRKKAESAILL